MKQIFDILKKGFDEHDPELGPKLAAGLALFGAALVINALSGGEKYPEERRNVA